MDKANIMKALEVCRSRNGCCEDCLYIGTDDCESHLHSDTLLTLLKADEKENAKPAYHKAFIFTKRDNLLKWFDVNGYKYAQGANMEYNDKYKRMAALYATEREIQLILCVRYENGKCICRIKCPINPLPIKGEFQCVSISEMTNLLTSLGWSYKEKLGYSLLFT